MILPSCKVRARAPKPRLLQGPVTATASAYNLPACLIVTPWRGGKWTCSCPVSFPYPGCLGLPSQISHEISAHPDHGDLPALLPQQAHVNINTYCATGASSLSCTKAASTGVVIPHGATSQRVIRVACTPHLKDCAENGSMRWPDFPSLPNLKGPVSSCWLSKGDWWCFYTSPSAWNRGLWTGGRARASFSWVGP